MSDFNSSQKWFDEFQTFMTAEPVDPPRGVTDNLFATVRHDLNPSAWRVFFKLGLIHTVVGSLTLLICPQFGFGPGLGLMKYLMKLGPHVCMFGCGVLFLGCSVLTSSFLLKVEEICVLRKTVLLQLAVLGLASIGVFICFGADVVMDMAAVWIFGSMLGGIGSLEVGWRLRSEIRERMLYGL